MKTRITLLASILLCMGCIKKNDPTPSVTNGNTGSWTYSGTTYQGTSSSWAANTLVSLADKPHSSGLEAAFSSANPGAGDYSISTSGQVLSNQVIISVVDSSLPALVYTSIDAGTVSVSRSGSSTTVTVNNIKLKGFTKDLKLDSIVVTGTIKK